MDQADGFKEKGKENLVCKLRKSISRLKQDFRKYLEFVDIVCSLGFKENVVE